MCPCPILTAGILYPAQEHERMRPVDPDPNCFPVKRDAELSRFQRYPKISSMKRRVSEISVNFSDR
jgi:hypothetical protein